MQEQVIEKELLKTGIYVRSKMSDLRRVSRSQAQKVCKNFDDLENFCNNIEQGLKEKTTYYILLIGKMNAKDRLEIMDTETETNEKADF